MAHEQAVVHHAQARQELRVGLQLRQQALLAAGGQLDLLPVRQVQILEHLSVFIALNVQPC